VILNKKKPLSKKSKKRVLSQLAFDELRAAIIYGAANTSY